MHATARQLKVDANRDPGSPNTRVGAAGWWWDDDHSVTGLQVPRIDRSCEGVKSAWRRRGWNLADQVRGMLERRLHPCWTWRSLAA